MKKSWIGIIVAINTMLIIFAGCGKTDLTAYNEAVEKTEAVLTGETLTTLNVEISYNEEGLSFDEIRELSYFEVIQMQTDMLYDAREDAFQMAMDAYFNFGGLGFDMIYYMSGDEVLVKMPLMDKYLDVQPVADESSISSTAGDVTYDAVKELLHTWSAVLEEEDVVSGQKAYVMTDKGQIKTTTYALSIDEGQFERMKEVLLDLIEDETFMDAFLSEAGNFSEQDVPAEAIRIALQEAFKSMSLVTFEGEAYVDFDGRLVKQTFECELMNESSKPGAVETIHVSYESQYDRLGEDIALVWPVLTEEDYLKFDEDSTWESYFPEGLFD